MSLLIVIWGVFQVWNIFVAFLEYINRKLKTRFHYITNLYDFCARGSYLTNPSHWRIVQYILPRRWDQNSLHRHLIFHLFDLALRYTEFPLHALDALSYWISVIRKVVMTLHLEDPPNLLVDPVDLGPQTLRGFHSEAVCPLSSEAAINGKRMTKVIHPKKLMTKNNKKIRSVFP